MDYSSIPSSSHDTDSLLYLVFQLKQSYPIWSEIRSNISTIWLLLIPSILHTHHGRINNHIHTITYCLAITTFQHSSSLINLGIRCIFIQDNPYYLLLRCRCSHLIYLYRHLPSSYIFDLSHQAISYDTYHVVIYELDKPTRHGTCLL